MRIRYTTKYAALCAAILCALNLFSSGVYGSLITYSDVSGSHVTYSSIGEQPTRSTLPGPAGALPEFGQPTGSGDSLSFPELSFLTDSSGGGGDTADSKLTMTITAKSNTLGISHVSFSEWGDYKLIRTSAQSDPFVKVSAIGRITILEVNGSSIDPIYVPAFAAQQFDHEYHLTGTQLTTDPLLKFWDGALNFNLDLALDQHQIEGYATRVMFTLDNSLLSISDASTLDAYIAKKDVFITATTVDVPEPSALILIAMATLGFVLWRRKQ